MKGILLAGGTGTRLHPLTLGVSKQLLPVYDKPLIYHPLSTLMLAGVRDILVITTPRDMQAFQEVLGDGSQWGLSLTFRVQPRPEGIAQAYVIGADFVGQGPSALALGDNLFYGEGLSAKLQAAATAVSNGGATVFAHQVRDPERYGVVAFDCDERVSEIQEKPVKPASNWAVTGLYFYDGSAAKRASQLIASERGELEITDLNRSYLDDGVLNVAKLGRGVAWLDTGTPESLMDAGHFVRTLEQRQGIKIACLEEVAHRMSFIDGPGLLAAIRRLGRSDYSDYLRAYAREAGAA